MSFKIVSKKQFSEKVFCMEIEAPLIAKSRKPGNFVIVRVDKHSERMPLTIADADIQTKVVVGCQVIDDLLSEMMHVDDDALETGCLQAQDDMMQQWSSRYRHECFGHRVGEGTQARAETCGEEHCLFHGCKDTEKFKV